MPIQIPSVPVPGLLPILFGLAALLLEPSLPQARPVTLTVGPEPQQTFEAFGFSITIDENPWLRGQVPAELRDEFARQTYRELNAKVVRFWFGPHEDVDAPGASGLNSFYDGFVRTGVTEEARRHGVETLLLAPWGFSPSVRSDGALSDISGYAEILAGNIEHMREHWGVVIDATGVMNEPGAGDRDTIRPSDYALLMREVRGALDRRGLSNVALLGPEFASADGQAEEFARIIENEPDASGAMSAMATHSYNMAANREIAEIVARNGWQYWQTEAGSAHLSADIAARFLNDLNNGVTHWIYFIGPHSHISEHSLIAIEGGEIRRAPQYDALKQITARFLPGTVMRHVRSDLDGSMVYTYGQKPHLNAAAGVRPDGRWAIGIANISIGGGWEHGYFHPPEDHDLTIEIPELRARGVAHFELCRTRDRDIAILCDETVTVENGVGTVRVHSSELVTLVARE